MKTYKYIRKSFTDKTTGERHWVYGRTMEEAIIKREELKRRIAEGTPTSNMLFRVWADKAIETYKQDTSQKHQAIQRGENPV